MGVGLGVADTALTLAKAKATAKGEQFDSGLLAIAVQASVFEPNAGFFESVLLAFSVAEICVGDIILSLVEQARAHYERPEVQLNEWH